MYFLGIYPDVHNCAFALVEDVGKGIASILGVWVVRQVGGKGREAATSIIRQTAFLESARCNCSTILIVEGQDVRYTGKTSFANPQDICNLALITGAAIAVSGAETVYSPLPREWKGTVRKDIKQRRVLDGLGIKYVMKGGKSPYPVPVKRERYEVVSRVLESDWKDITDAIGLAVWGMEKYKAERR